MAVTTNDADKIVNPRRKYFSYFNEFCAEIGPHDPWTQHNLKEIMLLLSTNSLETCKNAETKRLLSEYEVVRNLTGTKNVLLVANSTIEVLCFEDCFDVFNDAHNASDDSGHVPYEKMISLLDDYYLYHKKCLKYFMKSCTCYNGEEGKEIKKIKEPSKFAVQLDILDLKNIVGEQINRYCLVYVDNNSDYSILRMLPTTSPLNMGAELLKIFTDFGPPPVIQVIGSMVPNLTHTLKYVRTIMNFECEIESKEGPSAKSLRAFMLLKDLIVNQKTSNIMTACLFIQKALNSVVEKGESATQRMFGKRILSDIIEARKTSNEDHDIVKIEPSDPDDPLNVNNKNVNNFDKCSVCHEAILIKYNKCFKCSRTIHLLCGVRAPIPKENPEDISCFNLYCINCHRYAKRLKAKIVAD